MLAGKPVTPLCEQFGFDAEWRKAQLTLIGLDGTMREDVRLLQDRVLTRDVASHIVDRFFAQLALNPQASSLLSSFDLGHLKDRQVEYFKGFGVGFEGADYFENILCYRRGGIPMPLARRMGMRRLRPFSFSRVPSKGIVSIPNIASATVALVFPGHPR